MKKRQLTEFGKKVKTQLVKLGKTQKEFASEIGMDATYLTIMLHGERPGKKYIGEIAKRLNIDLNALNKSQSGTPNATSR